MPGIDVNGGLPPGLGVPTGAPNPQSAGFIEYYWVDAAGAVHVVARLMINPDGVGNIIECFDNFGNPIIAMGYFGGLKMFGDRLGANPPGDVFNSAFYTLTSTSDNVAANAAGIHLGYGATQNMKIFVGVGAPSGTNPTNAPTDGDVYFRSDGGAGTFIYQRRAGAWVASAA